MTTKNKKTTPIEPPVTALAVQTAATRELTPAIWRMITEIAPAMYQSHLFGVTSVSQAQAIMLKGHELGLSITASFELIHVIDGKPGLSPRGALALLHGNPIIKEIKITRLVDDKKKFIGYECYMSRRDNGFFYSSKFTLEMAQKAGLIKPNSGWTKYEENMCMYRAVGFTADIVAPDVTAGMTTLMKAPEMYGVALSESGDVIDAVASNVPSVDPLQELVTQYGAEAVMQANDGAIPTNEQVEEVRRKLEQVVTQ